MAHPAFWPTKSFYYPIGNTPPICLTQSLPPEADATVLLLGCGDPRNILYTLYSNEANPLSDKRNYDITCCDIEPAILARNILLFTLIVDDKYPQTTSQIWNIFYHFFLDEASNTLLLSQSRKLAELSADIETWNNSNYSTFLRVSSRLTLSELNRLWTLYAATGDFTSGQRKQLKTKFETEMKAVGKQWRDTNIGTGARAAGPLHLYANELSGKAYAYYWRTGLTTDNQKRLSSASIVNPTFAYAGKTDGCRAHYGTYPLPAFHLAPAFSSPQGHNQRSPTPTIFDLFRFTETQFLLWCKAFRDRYQNKAGRIILRFLLGDVFAMCFTLRAYADRGSQTAYERVNAWGMSYLTLSDDYGTSSDFPPPRQFLIIDTSNLADHMGMMNLLIAATPLLSRDPAATFFTETLLSVGEDPFKSFADRLCCDPCTFFVLFDLVPSNCLSGFTTHSNVHELLGYASVASVHGTTQYHERMAWRILSLVQDQPRSTLSLNPIHVSGLLYNIYLRMFTHEDKSEMFRKMSLSALRDASSIHHSRRTFALFIRHLTDRINTDWDIAIRHLLDHVRDAVQLLVGMNFYQELLCHLHILGLYDQWFEGAGNSFYPIDKHSGRFRLWKNVPSVVCLAMSVPRQHVEILNTNDAAINAPLQAQILSNAFCNVFVSLQISFGSVTVTGENEDTEIVISEDAQGRYGKSDAIIAFWVPLWVLCLDPTRASVLFGLVSTPANTMRLARELGLQLKLYSAPLMDSSKVCISRRGPITVADQARNLRSPYHVFESYKSPQTVLPPSELAVTLDSSCHRIVALTRHLDVTELSAQAELSKPDTAVTTTPIRGSGVDLSIGSLYKRRVYFPPVADGSKARLRIARKSSWVEVILPITEVNEYPLRDLPLVYRDESVTLWNTHYVDMDRLPSIDLDKTGRLDWFNIHVCGMFSDVEREQMNTARQAMKPLAQVKDSIHTILNGYAGIRSEPINVCGLNRTSEGGIDTLLFMTQLRFDLPAHTVVLDAYVLPLEEKLVHTLARPLGSLSDSRRALASVVVSAEELVVWKHLLPALTERCRTWKHRTDCAYIRRGQIPLSIQHSSIPICDCGRGIVNDAFKAHKEWAPFSPYVTRIAISPIFALSYLESVGQFETSKAALGLTEKSPSTSKQGGPQRCTRCGKTPPQAKLSACSVCKAVNYCGKDCQVADWKKHKAMCRKV